MAKMLLYAAMRNQVISAIATYLQNGLPKRLALKSKSLELLKRKNLSMNKQVCSKDMCEAFYGYGYTRQLKTETIGSLE